MYYVDETGIIVGNHEGEPINPPSGLQLIEGPEASISELYFDGTAILLKPERPSNTAIWEDTTHSWVEPPAPPEPEPVPNWAALGDALVADLAILNKLAANPLFAALVGRLQTLRQGAAVAVSDPEPLIGLWNNHSYSFTNAERTRFNDLATEHHIPLRVAADSSLIAQ